MVKIRKPESIWRIERGIGSDSECVKYKVLEVVSPNPHDDFLLCVTRRDTVHVDGTPSEWCGAFDLGDDTVLPDTPEVHKLVTEYMKHEKARRAIYKKLNATCLPFLKRIRALRD